MEKINKTGGLWNVAISLGAGLMAGGLAMATGATTALAVALFLGLGFLVSVVSLLHMHLAEREALEALEVDAIQAGRGGEALFNEGQVLPAKRSREQFERWGVPAAAVGLFLLQLYAVWHLIGKLRLNYESIAEANALTLVTSQYLGLAGAALLAVILFMRGQFAANLARIQRDRLLQPASDFILFSAYLLIALAAVMAVSFKEQRIDAWAGSVMAFLMCALALENLLSVIFEIYRPRVAGRQGRLLYRSRLVGLIAKPENLFTTAGKVLDYQFGFKVSETWGYRFLRERLGVMVGVQIILFWLSTSVVIIEPSERGRKLDLLAGANQAQWLSPGIHLKLPWPFAEVERYHPDQVHSFYVGLEPETNSDRAGQPRLWLNPGGKDYESLQKTGELYFPIGSGDSSSAENVVVPSIPVHYRIHNESGDGHKGLGDGWLKYSDPEGVLRNLAHREVSRYFMSQTLDALLREGREQAMEDVKQSLQARANELNLGVEILYVGMADLRPPAESPMQLAGGDEPEGGDPTKQKPFSEMPVAAAFEMYITADVTRLMGKFEARMHAQRMKSAETNQVKTILAIAENDAQVRLKVAEARVAGSRQQNEPYRKAPFIYPLWLYLQAAERSLADTRKFIVAVKNAEISSDIDLKESIRRGMLDVKVPTHGGNK